MGPAGTPNTAIERIKAYFTPGGGNAEWSEARFVFDYAAGLPQFQGIDFNYDNAGPQAAKTNKHKQFSYWLVAYLRTIAAHGRDSNVHVNGFADYYDALALLIRSPVDLAQAYVPPEIGEPLYRAAFAGDPLAAPPLPAYAMDAYGNAQGDACTADTQFSQFNGSCQWCPLACWA